MSCNVLLALNAGSATLKFRCFLPGSDVALAKGLVDGVGRGRAHLTLTAADGSVLVDQSLGESGHAAALGAVLAQLDTHGWHPVAVVHRIVHGGTRFRQATRLDTATIDALRELSSLAPLHQPVALAAIDALTTIAPDTPQIGCFDTAFHTTQDPLAARFGIARHWHDRGVQRYGFHGLSYATIAHKLPALIGPDAAEQRVVVLHLGSGASACALHQRRSVASSMGFSAADGLLMSTRPGGLDPEVVLYWQEQAGMNVANVRSEIYKRSGLLGVSGISADMRDLQDNDRPEANEAVELFCYRAAREVGALAVQAGGLDHIVFTAGIGERSTPVRRRIVERLSWLGFQLDAAANDSNALRISTVDSPRGIWVIPTDEEGQMAREAAALIPA
ncbi:acetate/propionate family kinase [Microvirgula aerodenitrificans]|uniref:acetate/propionate family kinase n=1 Tax=Microvirgula aerodenitrificans TaxID=57480 RepID=UPI000491EC96|nr:acetate/propionate family kinase [Microvirgula aerodenitrificans]